jgi:hypothetical protein
MKLQFNKFNIYQSKTLFCILIMFQSSFLMANTFETDTVYSEVWELNSLEKIGGHSVQIFGNPQIVNTEHGKAMKFNGVDDMLLVDYNPLGALTEYTVEVIFKPDAAFEISNAPRFIHFQDPTDTANKRVLMELRLNQKNEWWLDGFMLTDRGELTLVNETLTHPIGEWEHAAITYKNNTFRTFINGVEELNGQIGFFKRIINEKGKTSIGARMDKRNYYCGLIKTLKITRKALEPHQFIHINN